MLIYDPRKIFGTAEMFFRAANLLFGAFHQGGVQVIPPSLTCYAFCLELYFKCLATLEKGGYKKGGHDLADFLDMISPESQEKLRTYTTETAVPHIKKIQEFTKQQGLTVPPDFDFDVALRASKDAFVNWRYVYEANFKINEGWQANSIILAIRRIIIEIQPEWASELLFPLSPG